jgi:putative hemolysin
VSDPTWLLVAASFLSFYAVLSREAMTELSLSDMEELLRKTKRTKDLLPKVEAFAGKRDRYEFSFLIVNFLAKAVAAVAMYLLASSLSAAWQVWLAFLLGYALWLLVVDVPLRPFAARHAERITLWLRKSWIAVYLATKPLTICFSLVYGLAERLVRPAGEDGKEEEAEEDIMASLALGELQGQIAEHEREMIENILSLNDRTAEEVMTPRTDMDAIEIEEGLDGAIALATETGHSRLPVYEGNRDNIIGILYVKDLIAQNAFGDDRPEFQALLRKATFVPESKNVAELFAELRKERIHMAVVLDEYGGTAGLLTLEDLVEVVFGEIADEYDEDEEEDFRQLDESNWDFDARVKVGDLNEKLDVNLPESENYESLGGLVAAELGCIPAVGASWTHEDVLITVTQATERRVVRLHVERHVSDDGSLAG